MQKVLRLVLKLAAIVAFVVVLLIGFFLGWLFLYSGDLPDLKRLKEFAPKSRATVSDPCLVSPVIAIPYDSIGANFRNALASVEVAEDDPGALVEAFRASVHRAVLSEQIARTMFCEPSKAMARHLNQLRISVCSSNGAFRERSC